MASDYLLEIDGIKGESQDKKHKDTIEVESFSWGASQPGSFASGSGGGAGKASFQDLHFTSTVNKASPLLAKACATGQHIKKAVLFVRKAGGAQEDFYSVTLEDVLISSYQSGGHGGSTALPTDQFSLNYAKIKFVYQPQDSKGKLGGAVPFEYDLKAGVSK
jgi:type VI secretion system secreted protein Hcp